MRLFVAIAAALLVAVPASATEVDPKLLVLQQADVPAGFQLDRDESGVRTNAGEAKSGPEARALIARAGRVTGYEASWSKESITLQSRVDLCERSAGARVVFDYIEDGMKLAGIKGLRREPAGIGSESWVYWAGPRGLTLVAWRHGRVFAGIVGLGLTKARALALARVQQRRITAALR